MIEDLLLKYFFTKKNNLSVEELKDKNDNELTFDERLRLINSSIDDNNIITIIESLVDKK